MKIIIASPRYHTNLIQLIEALKERGHNVYFHAMQTGATEDHSLVRPLILEESRLSVLIRRIFGDGGVTLPRKFPKIFCYYRLISHIKPDIAIIRDPSRWFSKLLSIYCLLLNVKIVFYTQEALHRKIQKRTILKKRFYIKLFKAAWMSPIVGEKTKHIRQIKDMFYVPLPVQVCRTWVANREKSNRGIRILCIGKYHQERKKLLLFLHVLERLQVKFQFTVTIIGECVTKIQKNKYEKLEKYINESGLHASVTLEKNVPYREMAKRYTTHDLFVLPSINEPYAISITEALGYGLPSICTDSCGSRYHIKDGFNGFVVKSDSQEELLYAIEKFLSGDADLVEMSDNALEYARKNLSRDVFASHFKNLMQQKFNVTV